MRLSSICVFSFFLGPHCATWKRWMARAKALGTTPRCPACRHRHRRTSAPPSTERTPQLRLDVARASIVVAVLARRSLPLPRSLARSCATASYRTASSTQRLPRRCLSCDRPRAKYSRIPAPLRRDRWFAGARCLGVPSSGQRSHPLLLQSHPATGKEGPERENDGRRLARRAMPVAAANSRRISD